MSLAGTKETSPVKWRAEHPFYQREVSFYSRMSKRAPLVELSLLSGYFGQPGCQGSIFTAQAEQLRDALLQAAEPVAPGP